MERAAFVLHEVFDYDYARIAQVVDRSEASCRQLVSRDNRHRHRDRPRFDADPASVLRDADHRVWDVLSIVVTGGRIGAVRIVRNPDKLRHL